MTMSFGAKGLGWILWLVKLDTVSPMAHYCSDISLKLESLKVCCPAAQPWRWESHLE